MTSAPDRKNTIALVDEAREAGAGLRPSCEVVGISVRTYQRWVDGCEDLRPTAVRPVPQNKLSPGEREEVLATCHSPEFASQPPSQIVPRLADRGVYLASESTFYRVLREAGETTHRGRARAPRKLGVARSHRATRPNQVWAWDITWLKGPIDGKYFYLYLFLDIYSRKVVGWEVYEKESSELAAQTLHRVVLAERATDALEVLHSDNGSPQKGSKLLAKLEALQVAPSNSRPRVSNDNAHAESIFRTCKYRPDYPRQGFGTLAAARTWVSTFVTWYNDVHLHSGIQYVTPGSRHRGEDVETLGRRHFVYQEARRRRPERWSRGTRDWSHQSVVFLNRPPAPTTEEPTPELEAA